MGLLQWKNRSWDHFLFWLGFITKQEDQEKKSLMNNKFGFVKRFKKELIDDLMKDNVQENSLGQEFKEPMDEDGRKILDGDQEIFLEIHRREKIVVSNNEEDMGPIEQKQSSTCIQQISTKVFCGR